MEDSKPLTQLRPALYNPRRIDDQKRQALNMSMSEYGDLSGIVQNNTTGNLVTGHQRIRDLMRNPKAHVQYTEKLDRPDSLGTVARGYVVVDGTDYKFTYREVAWDHVREKAANVIANYAQGEFVTPLLASVTNELAQLGEQVAAKTGQSQDEIKKLLKTLERPKPNEQPPAKIILSQAGITYRLGSGTITAGAGELEFVDEVRQNYADKNGQLNDWENFTPMVVQTRAENPPTV